VDRLRPWLPTLIAALGVVLVLVLQSKQSQRVEAVEVATGLTRAPVPEGASAGDVDPSLAERVDRLEREVAGLRERRRRGGGPRVAALMPREVDMPAPGAPAPGGDPIDPEALVAEGLASDAPEVQEQLRAAVSAELERERDERWQRRSERWKEDARERLTALADEVALDETEVVKIGSMLDAERDEISALFRTARQDGTFREARREAVAARERTDENVRALLDDDKYDGWQKMREREREDTGWLRRRNRNQDKKRASSHER
jgi:hypothetical protein